MSNDENWDPPVKERHLVRSSSTGELGWLVKRGGVSKVRLDRPNQEVLRDYHAADWLPEEPQRPLGRPNVARVAFEADKALCAQLGLSDLSRRDWSRLSELERARYEREGPQSHQMRALLFNNVQSALKEFVR